MPQILRMAKGGVTCRAAPITAERGSLLHGGALARCALVDQTPDTISISQLMSVCGCHIGPQLGKMLFVCVYVHAFGCVKCQ